MVKYITFIDYNGPVIILLEYKKKVLNGNFMEEDPWEDYDRDGETSGGTPRCC